MFDFYPKCKQSRGPHAEVDISVYILKPCQVHLEEQYCWFSSLLVRMNPFDCITSDPLNKSIHKVFTCFLCVDVIRLRTRRCNFFSWGTKNCFLLSGRESSLVTQRFVIQDFPTLTSIYTNCLFHNSDDSLLFSNLSIKSCILCCKNVQWNCV